MSQEIKLRALALTDIEKLFDIYSDQEAMKYRGSKPMETIEDAKIFVKNKKLQEGTTITIRKAVELVSAQELIGSVMFKFDEQRTGECEIGYSIGRKYWGKGMGNQVVKILINSIERDASIKSVKAWSNKNNKASIKILVKNGFQRIEQTEHKDNELYQRKSEGPK